MADEIETDLPDLTGVTLRDLLAEHDLGPYREVLLSQVDRPRVNLGTGPPGRAD